VKNYAIARRYAKALLLIGKDDGQADTYRDQLSGFAGLISQEKELNQAICNPLYETADRKKVLQAVIEKMEMSGVIRAFLLLLFDKGRIGFIDTIDEFYQKLADELKGVATASLVSAAELSEDTIEKVRQALSNKTGKDIKLEVEQDPSLIGRTFEQTGVIVENVTGISFTSRRSSQKKGDLSISGSLFREIVIDDKGMLSLVPEVFGHGTTGIRSDILQCSGI